MDYRKLIKFGENSFVVSLPKTWLKKNSLEKGNLVYLSENGNNELVLTPTLEEKKKEVKQISIAVDGKKITQIKRELISAYLNDYTTVKLAGKDLEKNAKEIRGIIQNIMALEIVGQTKDEIVTQDFLNLRDISLTEFIRKMDIITRSILGDLHLCIDQDLFANIDNREQDINVMSFVILRAVRRGLNDPEYAKNLQLTSLKLFELWNVASYIELIGDQIREVAMICPLKNISPKQRQFVKQTIATIEQMYLNVMKAHYNYDPILAHESTNMKNGIVKDTKDHIIALKDNKCSTDYCRLLERLTVLSKEINKIARRVYS